ncbi:MAG: hypothetical protein GY820_33595 [Gammaproteobacteria bacterium]|nr:hypothetical protein [Gammaproteobacteria bacterium]
MNYRNNLIAYTTCYPGMLTWSNLASVVSWTFTILYSNAYQEPAREQQNEW